VAALAAGRGVTASPGLADLVDLAHRAALTEVELWRVSVPLVTPHRAAHGTETDRQVVLVRVGLGDGTSGWGECPTLTHPTYAAEYTAGAFALLRDEVVPWLLGGPGAGPVGHPMATAAVLTAHLDATLRQQGVALAERLGSTHGRPSTTVATTAVVGRHHEVDALLATVAARVGAGAALVKLKVSPHPADLEAARAVRSTWPDLALAVDANGTLDARAAALLDELSLVYLEQPAPADDLLGSAALARRLSCPVALDESVTSLAALEVAVAVGAGTVVNVKPARLGPAGGGGRGRPADAGCGVFVGGMLETAVGRAPAAVAALPVCTFPTALGPSSRYFASDLAAPLVVDAAGRLEVPSGPGIGVTPDPAGLQRFTVDHGLWRR
jgi:O-succinylbenzoate synthase